jgi:YidC/Oxa1 family membrane protein insertase
MSIIATSIIQEAFGPLITVFEAVLVFIHDHIVAASWGLAIVGLTVVVRAVMLPATFSQFRSMRNMQLHAPQLKAIKEKYKDDKQRQQEETLKYMRESGVNPLASCLPLALQFPVFISLFYMLRTDLKKHICGPQLVSHYNALSLHARQAYHVVHATSVGHLPSKYIETTSCQTVAAGSGKFLFVPDVTAKATGIVLVALIALYLASQIVSTLLMSSSAEPSQRVMVLVLPLVFVVILYRYPAGLLIYWITTNLWTIAQGFFVRRRVSLPPAAPGEAGKGPGKGPPPGVADDAVSNGKKSKSAPSGEPALAGVGGGGGSSPPPPPRKKKKRSGRRR